MVKCPNCGEIVQEGKFCEKCGSSLANASIQESAIEKTNYCSKCGAVVSGKFCGKCGTPVNGGTNNYQKNGSFFGNVKANMSKTATDIMAIKSNFQNDTLICMINKIPNVQEKKIKVSDDEIVYFNGGSGFEKSIQTFNSNLNSFFCFYVKKETKIKNAFSIDLKTKIMKLDTNDTINIVLNYDLLMLANDIDKFFYRMMKIRQDTWKELEFNALLSEEIREIICKNIEIMLENDGNLDLRNMEGQVSKFNDEIKNLINKYLEECGVILTNFSLRSIGKNINEINKVLVDNLYKEA